MPCSCGISFCPCGIPCYCLSESCKCQDCAIALSRFCQLCSKPVMSHRRTDDDVCSCFIGESTALILENRDIPTHRMGNIPMPINHFVTGKLIVNVAIPIPTLKSPHFISQQPFCLVPPVLSMEESQRKNKLASKGDVLKPLSPSEDSDSSSTERTYQLPRKFNSETNDYDSSGYSSNSEQNAEISSQKTRPPPGMSQSIRERKTINIDMNAKTETEKCANFREQTSFYLPSVIIDNNSYPVRMEDPIWRLPNPEVCGAVTPESTLSLINPFYVGEPSNTSQTMANYETFNSHVLNSTFGTNDVQCFTETKDGNLLEDSAILLQTNTLDPTRISENLVINGENVGLGPSSNDTIISSRNAVTEQSFVPSTFEPLRSQIKERVYPQLAGEPWQNVHLSYPFPKFSSIPFPIPLNEKGQEITLKETSKLQELFYQTSQSSVENHCFQKNNSIAVLKNEKENKENNPLCIYSYTTEKMRNLLKPLLKLSECSQILT